MRNPLIWAAGLIWLAFSRRASIIFETPNKKQHHWEEENGL